MNKTRNALLGIVLLASSLSVKAFAQDVSGTILGVVKDTSGAVIVGATITARDLGTNATHVVISDEQGSYAIRALPIGAYELKATMKGFKESDAKNIHLDVNALARVDLVLEVGNTSESVAVQADASTVDTETPTLKTVIGEESIENLPLNGRDPNDLVNLVAAVEFYRGTILMGPAAYPNTIPYDVNGGRGGNLNYILDGGENLDHYFNTPNPMPNPDALAEFNVLTSDYSAEYGYAGGVVNAVTKSGTNTFHGSAFEFFRNAALNAAGFFAPPNPSNPSEHLNDGLKRNQFGGTLGGPIRKDKLFFFISYQGTRTLQRPVGSIVSVPTLEERQGNFSALLPGTVLQNPSGGVFLNNQIPPADFNPATSYILQNIAAPNVGNNEASVSSVKNLFDNQGLARADYQVSTKNLLTGRYYISNAVQPGFFDPTDFYDYTQGSTWRNTSVLVSDAHTFSPALLNSVTFEYMTANNRNMPPSYPSKSWCDNGAMMTCDGTNNYYELTIQSLNSISTPAPQKFTRSEEQVSEALRWTVGRQYISIGGQYNHGAGGIENDFYSNGEFNFADAAGFTGNAIADFLLGDFSTFIQGVGEFKQTRFNIVSLFLQDSVKLTRRLTLDAGIRWEPWFPYTDTLGKLAVWEPGEQSTRYPNAPPGLLFAGDPGVPPGGTDKRWLHFGPRVGLAWDVTGNGKTSVRAGFGVFYDRPPTLATNPQADQAPFGTQLTVFGTSSNSVTNPWGGFAGGNPFTAVGFSAVGTSALNPPANVAFALPDSAWVWDPHFTTADIESWNLTLEREIARGLVGRISYAGSTGNHLYSGRDINSAVYEPGATTATTDQRRPLYPNFAQVALISGVGKSNYNALQANLVSRLKSLTFLANYTWSRSIDDNVNSDPTFVDVTVTDPFNQRFDKGPSDFNHKNVFNFSGIWNIPGRYGNKFVKGALGGWSLSTIVSLTSGAPFTVFDGQFGGVDIARSGQLNQRAEIIGDPFLPSDRSRGQKVAEYLNAQAFGNPPLGTYGNQGRNDFYGPGRASVDMGLSKSFPLGERVTGHFRFEAFNIFNRVNLEVPDNDITDSTFDQILSPDPRFNFNEDNPRVLQFALRLTW